MNDPRPTKGIDKTRACKACFERNHYGYWFCWKCDSGVGYLSPDEFKEVYQINLKEAQAKNGPQIKYSSSPKYAEIQNTKTGRTLRAPIKNAHNLQSEGTHKIIG